MDTNILPNFFIIGAPRCGTTTLYQYLSGHPDICFSSKKETWYFFNDELWKKGNEWYSKNFIKCVGKKAIGDATPLYYASNEALERIRDSIKNPKLIFIIRNPIDRAWSHFWMYKAKMKEEMTFSEAVKCDLSDKRQWKLEFGANNYVSLGFYFRYIQNILKFFERENLFVCLFDNLVTIPDIECKKIFEFLGVDNNFTIEGHIRENKNRYIKDNLGDFFIRDSKLKKGLKYILPDRFIDIAKNARSKILFSDKKPEMDDKIRDYLREIYKNDILSLETFLNVDLKSWING